MPTACLPTRHVGLPSGPIPIIASLTPDLRGWKTTCQLWCCGFHGWHYVTRWFGVDGEMVKPYRCPYGPQGKPVVDVLDTEAKQSAWRNR